MWGEMAKNRMKRHTEKIRERREPSVGLGRGKEPFSQTSARLASIANFFGSFSPTAELGPRLECLDEAPKNVIYVGLLSQMTAHVVKRVRTMFILVLLINITSILFAIRINTISVSANLPKVELSRYKTSYVSVLRFVNLGFVPFFVKVSSLQVMLL